MKDSHGMSLISSWFEEEMEQKHRTEYQAPSPFFFLRTNFKAYIVSSKQRLIQPMPTHTKTYADVLLSSTLPTRLLIISGNGSILGAMIFISGIDKTFANLLSKIIAINYFSCYWLVYLLILAFVLAINFVLTFLETHGCLSSSNDWNRVKSFIFQDRPIYNFNSGKKELTKIPLYVFIFIGLLIISSSLISLDVMVLSPLERFVVGDDSKYIFKYSSGVFYGIFLLSNIPPYLLLLMRILLPLAILNFKRWIGKNYDRNK